MDLSIIIVNWKSSAFLADCLASIYRVRFRCSFEIIVIDNASFDGCEKMLSERFPKVGFLQSQTNLGFAGANNLAFSHSAGEALCFLNPDTLIRGEALQTLYDWLVSIPRAGAVGALLFNGDGSLQTSCVLPFPTVMNQIFDIEWLRRLFPRFPLFGAGAIFSRIKQAQTVEAVSGACLMIHRKLFIEIGMFSSEYFMYAEDIDLCRKVRSAGKKVCLINAAKIVHYGGGSSKLQKNRLFGALLMRDSNYRLLRKFRGAKYALLYRLSLGGVGLLRLGVAFVCVAPAVVIGHGAVVTEFIHRWSYLVLWAVGIKHVPRSFSASKAET